MEDVLNLLNLITHTLAEAELTLYPADANGAPLTLPIWTGAPAENLSIAEKWIKVRTTPGGARHPKNHPLVATYEISIARVFTLQLDQLSGYQTNNGRYVLDIVWTDEETKGWHRKTFYGVTISERSFASRGVDAESTDGLVFDAEYFVPDGGVGTVPPITTALPLLVRYVDATGSRYIYVYSASAKTFTEYLTGIAASTAFVGYETANYTAPAYRSHGAYRSASPYTRLSKFKVQFAGQSSPALAIWRGNNTDRLTVTNAGDSQVNGTYVFDGISGYVHSVVSAYTIRGGGANWHLSESSSVAYYSTTGLTGNWFSPGGQDGGANPPPTVQYEYEGKVSVSQMLQGAPPGDQLPRVDFLVNGFRVASVTQTGRLYAWSFLEEPPVDLPALFEVLVSSVLLATIAADSIRSGEFSTR